MSFTQTKAITDETQVCVIEDFETREAIWTGTLGNFIASNEFTEEEEFDLRLSLIEDGAWVTGGGAAAAFRVEVVSEHEPTKVIPSGEAS